MAFELFPCTLCSVPQNTHTYTDTHTCVCMFMVFPYRGHKKMLSKSSQTPLLKLITMSMFMVRGSDSL